MHYSCKISLQEKSFFSSQIFFSDNFEIVSFQKAFQIGKETQKNKVPTLNKGVKTHYYYNMLTTSYLKKKGWPAPWKKKMKSFFQL